jgi:hypothetical protein
MKCYCCEIKKATREGLCSTCYKLSQSQLPKPSSLLDKMARVVARRHNERVRNF